MAVVRIRCHQSDKLRRTNTTIETITVVLPVEIHHNFNVTNETARLQTLMDTRQISLAERIHRKDRGAPRDLLLVINMIAIGLLILMHPDEVRGGVEAGRDTTMIEIEITEDDPIMGTVR
mmetsp:Transcript_11763/g.24300  ORF Transcript_11763/g.24300 Transcript_11763/m.24300 type:complete len:120 (-) Transcript_11763:16-375(-)